MSGGAGGASGELVSKKKYDGLDAENKKLKYRITHLLRALEEGDAGQGIPSGSSGAKAGSGAGAKSGETTKLYFTEQGMNSNEINQI